MRPYVEKKFYYAKRHKPGPLEGVVYGVYQGAIEQTKWRWVYPEHDRGSNSVLVDSRRLSELLWQHCVSWLTINKAQGVRP